MPADRNLFLLADLHDLEAAERLWDKAEQWRGRVDVFHADHHFELGRDSMMAALMAPMDGSHISRA